MAGLWPQSRNQILDSNDNLIVGALAYFYEAGTSTPMTTYSSVTLGEINEHPNPVVADGNARWPLVFFDDITDIDPVTEGVQTRQYYRVKVTDAGGSLIYDDISVPIIGQSEGGGGGVPPVPIDQTALAKTGDVKVKFGTTADIGWVRLNGQTIGSSSSGATERANADAQALYVHLWNNANNTICPIAAGGSRGANALADFNADKAITLPDMRGRTPFGIDAMGGLASGRIDATYMDTGGVNEVGASGGDDAIVLTTEQIPAHSHTPAGVAAEVGPPAVALKAPLTAATHTHLMADDYPGSGDIPSGDLTAALPLAERGDGHGSDLTYQLSAGTTANVGKTSQPATTAGVLISGGALAVSGFTGNTGGPVGALTGVSSGHENMPPFMLFTYLIKL